MATFRKLVLYFQMQHHFSTPLIVISTMFKMVLNVCVGVSYMFRCRKEPANWSHVAKSGDEDITTTQCEAYELTNLGHQYEDLSVYQEPEYEVPITKGPPNVPTSKSGE